LTGYLYHSTMFNVQGFLHILFRELFNEL